MDAMYPEWMFIGAAALIGARATRLFTRDVILHGFRARLDRAIVAKWGEQSPYREFPSCAWCVGWWAQIVAFVGVYFAWPGHDWTAPQLVIWFAAAATANIINVTAVGTTGATKHLAESAEIHLRKD